jgi:hypothetical protein
MSKFIVKVGNKYVGQNPDGTPVLVATQKEALKCLSRSDAADLTDAYEGTRKRVEPRTVKLVGKDD